jgi:acyl-CoA synthetase (AMP-forming)/AMP-acid ligase II
LLDALLASALAEHPGRAAVAHGDITLTFAELISAADRLAREVSLEPGERIMVVAPNVPALLVGMCAAWRAGAVAVPLSARLRRFELARALGDAHPSVVISVPSHGRFALAQALEELSADAPTLRARAVVDDRGEMIHGSELRAQRLPDPSPDDLAAILYTSGTTGEPKGALVPHRLAAAEARNLPELLGADAEAPYGLVPPASHAFGLGCALGGIAAGAMAVLVDSTTSIDSLRRAIDDHGAPILHGTPPLFARLLRSGAAPALRGGFVAGSWCPPDLLEALEERGARILNLYGMTEIGAAISCRSDDPPKVRYRTVGRALPGYQLRVDAQPGEQGEIQVHSDYLPSGYQSRPWRSEELAEGGWFRTGDLGELHPDGNLAIAGRAKDVIHVGGFNVFPAEVEAFLATHPAIAHAAVIGVPHPVLGEAPQAFVVPVGGAPLEPSEVISFARAGVAGYKVPYTVRVVQELPVLPSGKTDRKALALRAAPEEVAQ